ncbi:PhzF family phenazine biosynthesis protein [Bacillus cereus group sp. BfR-BA-01538]|uniref:PhzF family phenazine biosynthesis protein n=1 Tax=Bacillus cereus group sp. BfR-BA-01538 TaxID=2920373 RepID=UPI001F57FC27
MEKEFVVINSFSGKDLAGNPAAIFLDPVGLENNELQKIAKQLNLVETVFVYPSKIADFQFRYFTPYKEVTLAGHPTIAAFIALVYFKRIDINKRKIYKIETSSGIREVMIEMDRKQIIVKMKHSSPVFTSPVLSEKNLANTLGLQEFDISSNFPPQIVDFGVKYLVVAVKSLNSLMSAVRKIDLLEKLCTNLDVREVQLFSFETYGQNNDFHTRNLCPREGVEDPACGIGNAAVGAFLAKNYYIEEKSIHLQAEQGEIVNTPCLVELFISKNKEGVELYIGGTGKKIIEGRYLI